MRTRKAFTLIELLVVIAIIAVLAAILFPVFARARRAAQASNCQSNMKQIGNAIKMYLSDWDDTYMTNRNKTNMNVISAQCALSPPEPIGTETEPRRFQYSVNWVEGLYNYVETITKSSDPQSVWRCQAASNSTWPTPNPTTGYPYPAVNYVFNYNLLEQPEGIIKAASNLLMVREFWQTTIAELRPVNNSTGNGTTTGRPQYAFLNADLRAIGGNSDRACKLHSNGSHILFTDGHVKIFDLTFMPKYADITPANCWDDETQQWYNFAPAANKPAVYKRSIAISP